jgi:release factor glutamine methyltransferase
MTMHSIKDTLTHAIARLHTEEARIDSEILLAFVLNCSRTYLYTHPEKVLLAAQTTHFNQLIEKRRQGIPIAYLTGLREFWSLPLKVTEATLIPRPETEKLVEIALELLSPIPHARILDLGTGSGAIALALAHERPDWRITATDKSEAALQVAQQNAQSLQLSTIEFIHSDWFSAIPMDKKFHAIVSNPPYIATADPHLLQGDVRFEPYLALTSGDDGLQDLQVIIKQSLARLEKNGLLLTEHGYSQKQAVETLLTKCGFSEVQCWQDWQGNDRISGGRRIQVDE